MCTISSGHGYSHYFLRRKEVFMEKYGVPPESVEHPDHPEHKNKKGAADAEKEEKAGKSPGGQDASSISEDDRKSVA